MIFPRPRSPKTSKLMSNFWTASHMAALGSPTSVIVSAFTYKNNILTVWSKGRNIWNCIFLYLKCELSRMCIIEREKYLLNLPCKPNWPKRILELLEKEWKITNGRTPQLAHISLAFSRRAIVSFLWFSWTEFVNSGAVMHKQMYFVNRNSNISNKISNSLYHPASILTIRKCKTRRRIGKRARGSTLQISRAKPLPQLPSYTT